MNEDRRRILQMLGEGRVTPDEAERLLAALDKPQAIPGAAAAEGGSPRGRPAPKYLRVMVSGSGDGAPSSKNVNIRVPLQLLRAGVKLQGLLPPEARSKLNAALARKGVDFDVNQLKGDSVDEFIETLRETSIDIDASDGRARVRVFCE
jgi:hypothetical protein